MPFFSMTVLRLADILEVEARIRAAAACDGVHCAFLRGAPYVRIKHALCRRIAGAPGADEAPPMRAFLSARLVLCLDDGARCVTLRACAGESPLGESVLIPPERDCSEQPWTMCSRILLQDKAGLLPASSWHRVATL